MRINRKFARAQLKADGTPDYAPNAFSFEGRDYLHPTDDEYRAARYLDVIDEMPSEEPQEGYHWEAKGWEVFSDDRSPIETHIRRVYEQVVNPPAPPRVFSKLKCVAALMEAGVWHEVKSYIEGAGLYDLYLAAQDFREDNPYFVSGKAQLMASLGWTEEQIEAILSQCVIG